jgi:hypothetical protein
MSPHADEHARRRTRCSVPGERPRTASTRRRELGLVLLVGGATALGGCSKGDVASPSLPAAVPPLAQPQTKSALPDLPLPESPHVVRLTHVQWENTVRDLLRLDAVTGLSSTFPADPTASGGDFGRDASTLVVGSILWHEYREAALAAASLVVDNAASLDKLLPPAAKAADAPLPTRIRAFVEDLLPRAFRRPASPAEIDAAVAEGDKAAFSDVTSDPFTVRVRWILTATLQSPYFLYRVEGGEGSVTNGRVRLGPYELAEKLSYALWGTMPDATLEGYARDGKLVTQDGLRAVVGQMLDDSRADAQLLDFHEQLFVVDGYSGITRQPAVYPNFYVGFGGDAREDARRTIRELVIDRPGTVADLYASPVAFVNARLATVYGVDASKVPKLVANPAAFVKIAMGEPRRGLLSHAGWLAFEGQAKDPATIQRGAYFARHVLCIPLGSPPAAARGVDPANNPAPTDRGRVQATTGTCGGGCHTGAGGVINPLGFAFEEFDSLGQLRTKDAGFPIDSTGSIDQMPGAFTDAASLMSTASQSALTHACYAAHWSAYLNGASHVDATPSWLAPIVTRSLAGAPVRDLIADLVQTDAFLTVSRE